MPRSVTFLSDVFPLVVAVLLAGCSSHPSDKQAKADLQKWFDSRWPSTVLIVEYEAVNKERNGRKYVLEYRAKGQFIKDTFGCVPTCCGDVCFDKLVDGMRWITKASDNPHDIRKGDFFETRGKNTYTKTVMGWLRENS
jgi:hypothetical protein